MTQRNYFMITAPKKPGDAASVVMGFNLSGALCSFGDAALIESFDLALVVKRHFEETYRKNGELIGQLSIEQHTCQCGTEACGCERITRDSQLLREHLFTALAC